ncbi:MAG: alpha-mannosidase [Anaerolineae bacterium]|nr:alpha-mannosidase [Anaerolineales bacterium]MCQ3976290.1 alpha-mannosidase [Anaerolineae bacterium]
MSHKVRWTIEKITERLRLIEPLVYRRSQPLPPFRYLPLDGPLVAPPLDPDIDDSDWTEVHPYTYWGVRDTNFVLRSWFEIPPDWEPDLPVALYLPLASATDVSYPETLVYLDGVAYAASDLNHPEILLAADWADGQSHRLLLHGWIGSNLPRPAEKWTKPLLHPCAVVQIDQPTRNFIATARVALGVASRLDENEPAKGHLLNALDEAFKLLDTREPFDEAFYASVPPAHAALRAGIDRAGPPLDVNIVAAGHAHIDVAWLWTLGQTRHKAGRTFHTVLRLMEQFPEYHFTQSQPQLYDYIRQDYPDLLAAVKERVAEGRWEVIGGMWVEADCNLSGPESLARQFLLGRVFFREHFGPQAESPVLWLPDVFGYAWNLPQLIKQAGLEYFFTVKISWNQYNRLPYESFWWQGLDGARVLTHFSPTPDRDGNTGGTYNGLANPAQVLGTWTNFQQKEHQHELLMAYGYGDGGGGPTREMLENIREMAAFPATPRLCQGRVGDFFRRLEQTTGDRLPVWNGELYFERHRGTYTSQSRTKRANRQSEFLLHDAEFLAVLAGLLDPTYDYPAASLRRAWELVCLNQFHDIIPGSSIQAVYEESQQQYAQIHTLGAAVRDEALQVIANHFGGHLLLVNPTGFTRTDLAFWPGQLAPGQTLSRADGTPVAIQPTAGGIWLDAGGLPPFSVTPLLKAESGRMKDEVSSFILHPSSLTAAPDLLENNFLRVEFNASGDITRIFDKINQREVLPAGAVANQFQAFEDRPKAWDAWDVDIFYDDKMWTSDPATSVQVVEAGPLRATLEIRRRILHSDIAQRISLAYNSPRLDFDTTVNWQERHILLKVAFPVDILSPVATYEIQWGNVERPTHRNTSWDWARFETCAQKWVDLSEGNYGVSLLNDCKYGHDIRDNVIRLSLLRSPTYPDPEADQSEHCFVYSLFPHAGRWGQETIGAAYALNDPLIVRRGNDKARRRGGEEASNLSSRPRVLASSFLSVDHPNIVIETIKQAEDGNGIIVRLYESQRQRGVVTLTTGFNLTNAWQTNLLEEDASELPLVGNKVTFSIKPYEIVTLRLLPA